MDGCLRKTGLELRSNWLKSQHFYHDDFSHQREKDTDKQKNGICAFVHISELILIGLVSGDD